jgi:hypothetical protein
VKAVLATKMFKVFGDYPFITDAGWTGPDPHEGDAGHQDAIKLMRLSLYLLAQGGLDLTHMKVVLATRTPKISCDYLLID